jgi:hypothetical protein
MFTLAIVAKLSESSDYRWKGNRQKHGIIGPVPV